ncbi:hypothetical protein SB861_56945, partial [Paraburkholderia sp. SIMBA_049]
DDPLTVMRMLSLYGQFLLFYIARRVTLSTLRENGMVGDDFTPGELIEFNAPDGGRYAGVLKEVSETSALFDFNHPLAGQALTFEVKIIGIL